MTFQNIAGVIQKLRKNIKRIQKRHPSLVGIG